MSEPHQGVAALQEGETVSASPTVGSMWKSVENLPARFLWLVDLSLVVAAFVGAHLVAPHLSPFVAPGSVLGSWFARVGIPPSQGPDQFPPFHEVLGVLAIVAPATLMAFHLLGAYRPLLQQSRTRLVVNSLLGPLAGLGAVTMMLFAFRLNRMSRSLVFLFIAFSVTELITWRLGLRAYKLRRYLAGHYVRQVVLVGTAAHIRWLASYFARRVPEHAYHVLGCLLAPGDDASGEGPLPVPVLGEVGTLGALLVHRPISDVVAVQPDSHGQWLSDILASCDYLRVTLRIIPGALLSMELKDLLPVPAADALTIPSLLLRPVETDSELHFVKRIFDLVVATMALILLAPVFVIIAIAIKLTTPHLPVFYPWPVVGYKGRPFVGYKFTTMRAGDQAKAALAHLNEMKGPAFKITNDPRVTKLGRVLRKYSLNELPQFWSVVRGDMSLVGPRPPGPHELIHFEDWHRRKLSVTPGITCLWQVRGRNKITNFDDWVRMDLEYIDRWSLWLDFTILVRTVWVVVKGTGS
jgi:exopolysaccharide biosynthesis polyprenyl glycosylphosphotransferase